MFTLVCQKEHADSGIRFFSLAPGIIDTAMQAKIRSSSEEDFPAIERFKSYKTAGMLSSSNEVALKIGYLLANSADFEEVIQDVRTFDLP